MVYLLLLVRGVDEIGIFCIHLENTVMDCQE